MTAIPTMIQRFLSNPFGRILFWAVVIYLVMAVIVLFMENTLVYPATKFPAGDWRLPDGDSQDVEFQSADGTKLHGWYAPAPQPTRYILYLHGNGGNISHRRPIVSHLRDQHNASVFIFDYRGYGKSGGEPFEAGVMADARAARAKLAELAGVKESEIILLGRSMGGAVAVDLAAELAPPALILQSTFSSMPDVAASQMPWFPVHWMMRNRFDSFSKIKKYQGPLLMTHSVGDEVIPFKYGRKLFENANDHKVFFEIDDCGHNDEPVWRSEKAVKEFFEGLE